MSATKPSPESSSSSSLRLSDQKKKTTTADEPAASEEEEEMKTKLKEIDKTIDEFAEGASLCKVYENVWIGDIGSATMVAKGLISGFGAVFNASGCECWGATFEHKYHERGIEYDTLADYETGFSLDDGRLSTTATAMSELLSRNKDVEPLEWIPRLAELADPEKKKGNVTTAFGEKWVRVPMHWTPVVTEAIFFYLMLKAADKIAALVAKVKGKRNDRVLVHCYAGMNRSASSIVSYFMRRAENTTTFEYIADIIREATTTRRMIKSLGNEDFNKALGTIHLRNANRVEKLYWADVATIKQWEKWTDKRLVAKESSGANSPPTLPTIGCGFAEYCESNSSSRRRSSYRQRSPLHPRWSCRNCCAPMWNRVVCSRCRKCCYCSQKCQIADAVRHFANDACEQ